MPKEKFTNTLYTNDNLYILYGMNSNTIDLIYLDPPFNSKRTYSAPIGSKAAGASFKDMWTWSDVNKYYLDKLAEKYYSLARDISNVGEIHSKAMMAYLTYMAQRIIEMHRVLKDTGSIYLHCDPTASHYLKRLLDAIFGEKNFRNEIIWYYESGGIAKSHFSKKHDVILVYSKNINNSFFNIDAVGMPRNVCPLCKNELEKWNHLKKHVDTDGRVYRTIKSAGKIYKYYDDENVNCPDVWIGINHIHQKDPERTGYPTQKPLALLQRIIQASSNEGDIVFDPFCGCATACVAAQQLDRKWIGIDIEAKAASVLVERLSDDAGLFKNFINTTMIPKRTDVEEIEPTKKSVKERLYKEQEGKCNGCGKDFGIENLEVDHIVAKAHGGGDYYENYQLLCGSCNRIKGARPMEYLRMKIEVRESMMKTKVIFGE